MKRLADQTLYEILDVREDAAAAEIEAACQRAVLLYGPGSLATYTLMTPDEAALLARRIDEARATLLDPAERARYDEGLQRAPAEAVAAATSAAPPPRASLPPVIPALKPAPDPDEPDEADEADEAEEAEEVDVSEAQPAILLAAAVATAADVGEAGPQKPILLEREVAAPPEPPAPPPPVEAAPPPEAPLPAVPASAVADGWTGDALRRVRESRGLTIQQIADRTKVTRHHIENIEGDRFGALPAPVYLRGILLSIARELRLDGQKVARSYLERAQAARSK